MVNGLLCDLPFSPGHLILQTLLERLYVMRYTGTIPLTEIPVQLAGTLWFLPGLLAALLIVRIALRFRYSWSIIAPVYCIGYILDRYNCFPMYLTTSLVAALYVYLGYLAKQFNWIQTTVYRSLWLPFVALIAGGFFVNCFICTGVHITHDSTPVIDVLTAVCMTYLTLRLSDALTQLPRVSRILTHLGSSTLFLFCAHAISGDVIGALWPKDFLFLHSRGILSLVAPFAIFLLRDGIRLLLRRRGAVPLPNET